MKALLEKVRADSGKSLVPQETDEEVIQSLSEDKGDILYLELFQLIGVKSCDIGFTWKTHMLMSNILGWAMEAETIDDLEKSIEYFDAQRNTTILEEKCKPYLQKIFDMGKQLS